MTSSQRRSSRLRGFQGYDCDAAVAVSRAGCVVAPNPVRGEPHQVPLKMLMAYIVIVNGLREMVAAQSD